MNIIIITVYNHDNCGSFLQAYALGRVLLQKGHNVSYLKSPLFGKDYSRLYTVIKQIYYGDIKAIPYFLAEHRHFKKAQKLIHIYNQNTDPIPDVVIIGSDTLWNHQKPFYRSLAKEYHGLSFPDTNVITYAISAANTSKDEYYNTIKSFKKQIKISHFLARDKHTKDIIDYIYGVDSKIVCDPTLLLHKDDYDNLVHPISSDKYLLLYYFSEMNDSQKEKVKLFAKNNELRIVSFSFKKPWGDKVLIASPYNFISWFKEAKFILTDSFHGTAFSIIFGKKFAVFDEDKIKVKELLKEYNLTDHLFRDYKDLENTLLLHNDVIENGTYETIRERSLNFLDCAVSV